MLSITWRTIRDKKISLIIYTVATIGMLWVYVGMFPSIKAQSETMAQAFQSFPEAFMKAFNIEDMNFTHVENFVAMEQYSIIWPLLVLFLLLSFTGTTIAGEVEKGTAELQLSQPVSRTRIFFEKYTAGMLAFIVFSFLTVFAVVPLASLQSIDYQLGNFVKVFWLCLLFGWAVFSVGMLCSSFFSERSRVYGVAGGIFVLMYVLNIISALKDNLENLKYFSFFHYFDASSALIKGVISAESVWVFVGVALATTLVAAWRFKKRDVAV